MKTSHTQGQWKITGELKNQIRCKDNHVLANVNPLNVYGKEETQANTKLMAAAPELLEALNGAKSLIERMCIVCDLKEEGFNEYNDSVKAIKKATE